MLGTSAVLTSPASFLVRPARWMQLLATNPPCPFTAAPNFAFDLATRKTSDDDMAGLDLGGVHTIQSGAERVQPATIKRFTDRFARFNLNENVIQPSYGMAEATLYMSTPKPEDPIKVVHFDSDALTGGEAKRVSDAEGDAADQLRRPPHQLALTGPADRRSGDPRGGSRREDRRDLVSR